MLNEEVAKYRELSGDTNPNTPISRIGGYLDGYEKALKQGATEFEEIDFVQEHKKIPVTLDLTPCEDAISREDALMCLTGEIKETDTIETIIARSGRRIRKLPPVNPTKTGHWISKPHIYGVAFCSECGFELKINNTNYCPNCGCRMIEPQEENEEISDHNLKMWEEIFKAEREG